MTARVRLITVVHSQRRAKAPNIVTTTLWALTTNHMNPHYYVIILVLGLLAFGFFATLIANQFGYAALG